MDDTKLETRNREIVVTIAVITFPKVWGLDNL